MSKHFLVAGLVNLMIRTKKRRMQSPTTASSLDMQIRNLLKFKYRKRLPKEFGGERIYVTGRADRRVLKPGWVSSAHDLLLVARKSISNGMVVWDLGANLGILSALAAYKVGQEGAVYALEADPFYADLIFNTSRRLSPAYQPINVLCGALADRQGILEFGVSSRGHARSKLVEFSGDQVELEAVKSVLSVRGDDLLETWRSPNFVKIDIEGAELLALSGFDKVLSEARPSFYIEVSPENQQAVSDIFRSYDYQMFHLKGDGGEEPISTCSFYTIARPSEVAKSFL